MDQDEDYKDLFFTECDELLAELQDHLTLMSGGEHGRDIVDATFRAVHSVKGGAAAFGLDALTGFAHRFEAVMDACRAGRLDVDDTTLPILFRASDMMQELVEHSRSDAPLRDDVLQQITRSLDGLVGIEPEPSAVVAADTTVQTPPAADGEPIVVTFRPEPNFLACAHDPLRMLRGARRIGLMEVRVAGDLPPLEDLDPMVCPWTWHLTFAQAEPSVLRDFFSIYDLSARIDGVPTADAPATLPLRTSQPSEGARVPTTGDGTGGGYVKSLRVPLDRIDRLVNLVGEIVITQAAVAQVLSQPRHGVEDTLAHSIEALSRQVREMQDSVMAIRAQPIKSAFSRMPRIVRDLSATLEREVRIEVSGEETEVDTSVIEELIEPLTHMIRNAMDHGIEPPDERLAAGKARDGLLRLTAQHRGERVLITLEDDGRGLNRDKIVDVALQRGLIPSADGLTAEDIDNLIFLPGFSTASEVSNVSGRGVGMDVVRRKIQALGGRCLIHSTPGQGTRFQVALPLTLAVLEGMIVEVAQERYVVPLSTAIEAVQLRDGNVERLHNGQILVARRGEYLPVYSLADLFGSREQTSARSDMAIVVDTETDGQIALFVDALIGQRQVVLKGLEENYRAIAGVSGATILGDGRVALILDIPSLIERRKLMFKHQSKHRQETA